MGIKKMTALPSGLIEIELDDGTKGQVHPDRLEEVPTANSIAAHLGQAAALFKADKEVKAGDGGTGKDKQSDETSGGTETEGGGQ